MIARHGFTPVSAKVVVLVPIAGNVLDDECVSVGLIAFANEEGWLCQRRSRHHPRCACFDGSLQAWNCE